MPENPPAGKPPRLSAVEMTEMVLPNDANVLGNMLGGRVLHLMDICGAMAAIRHSGHVCVTASMERVDFIHPIRLGQAVLLKGTVHWAGRTSIEVGIDVFAEDLLSGQRRQTCSAIMVFVALGADGRPAAVPPVLPETEEEQRRFRDAEQRHRGRKQRHENG